MIQGVYFGLVSVMMSSRRGNDMSVNMVVANNIYQVSYGLFVVSFLGVLGSY